MLITPHHSSLFVCAHSQAGFTPSELKKDGFGAGDVLSAGFDIRALHIAGFTAAQLARKAGFSCAQLLEAGYSVRQLYDAGASVEQLMGLGFSTHELRLIGGLSHDELNYPRPAALSDRKLRRRQQRISIACEESGAGEQQQQRARLRRLLLLLRCSIEGCPPSTKTTCNASRRAERSRLWPNTLLLLTSISFPTKAMHPAHRVEVLRAIHHVYHHTKRDINGKRVEARSSGYIQIVTTYPLSC